MNVSFLFLAPAESSLLFIVIFEVSYAKNSVLDVSRIPLALVLLGDSKRHGEITRFAFLPRD